MTAAFMKPDYGKCIPPVAPLAIKMINLRHIANETKNGARERCSLTGESPRESGALFQLNCNTL